MTEMHRRGFILSSLLIAQMKGGDAVADPWSKSELIEPADLAARLSNARPPLHILYAGFPMLYRQKHIPGAQLAGPANKPDALSALRGAARPLPRDAEVIVYCGCCPMQDCPNIRPAYRLLKDMGFKRVRVLDLPANFHTDWVAKGYPVTT